MVPYRVSFVSIGKGGPSWRVREGRLLGKRNSAREACQFYLTKMAEAGISFD